MLVSVINVEQNIYFVFGLSSFWERQSFSCVCACIFNFLFPSLVGLRFVRVQWLTFCVYFCICVGLFYYKFLVSCPRSGHTSEALVTSHAHPYQICGGKGATGTVFCLITAVFPTQYRSSVKIQCLLICQQLCILLAFNSAFKKDI